MGTRSLTFVYSEHNNKPVINLYRQFDGYPSGHGAELAEFLNGIAEVTNGISLGETRRTANGMGCLAAQMVAHFKSEVGGFYLHNPDETDCWQDYTYHVYKDRVEVKGYEEEKLFTGSWQDFETFCHSDHTG